MLRILNRGCKIVRIFKGNVKEPAPGMVLQSCNENVS